MLAVGATSNVNRSGDTPQSAAIFAQTASGGTFRVSNTPTTLAGCSLYPISSNSGSREPAARMGPDPIAKYFSPVICQPAYCDAMQAASGWSVATVTAGPGHKSG